MMKRLLAAALGALMFAAPAWAADADFFKGKTVTYIVATGPGGGYDTYSRLIARYLQKYLPGSRVLVRNVPGAGHIVGANTIYAAKPDGLTIGMFQTHMYLQQMVQQPEVKFDVLKFNWVGSQERGTMMLYIRGDAPYRSIEDVITAKEPPKCEIGRAHV